MGFLRKLAELVVEFPEEPQAATPAESEQDVLASIEAIRGNMEAELSKQRETLQEATAAPGGESTDGAGGSAITIPAILHVTDVYERAGLQTTPEGFNIYTVERMLTDPEIADLPLETRARSVRMALRSMGKELTELIEDAARRDQALEVYEQFVEEAIGQVSTQVAESNARLQSEMDELVREKTAQMEANRAALALAKEGLAGYRSAKKDEEQRLFDTVAPFVAPGKNPVQVNFGAPAKPQEGS
jgi:hypothetical protein